MTKQAHEYSYTEKLILLRNKVLKLIDENQDGYIDTDELENFVDKWGI